MSENDKEEEASPHHDSKTWRVRITNPGNWSWNTKIVDNETGVTLPRVRQATIHIGPELGKDITADVVFIRPIVDVIADATCSYHCPNCNHEFPMTDPPLLSLPPEKKETGHDVA